MAKSAAEERRELSEAVTGLTHQVKAHAKALDEAQADRAARAAAFADFRVEAAIWRTEALAHAREFADFKHRAEVREQRWWAFAMTVLGAGLAAVVYYLRKQP